MTKYKIESTKNLGGVIGISYTASLPSTTNISLNKIEFSIINEQESPQAEWIFSKERGIFQRRENTTELYEIIL